MNNRDNHPSEYEFLRPLLSRPDLDPDEQFVKSVRRELIQKSVKQTNWKKRIAPFTIGSLAIITLGFLIFLYTNKLPTGEEMAIATIPNAPDGITPIITTEDDVTNKGEDDLSIAEYEKFEAVLEMKYGTDPGEIAMPQIRGGGSELAPESFFVKDNVFYLLDNAGKKVVVTTEDQHLLTIQLDKDSWLIDIFVDEEESIYVLGYSNITSVSKFDKDGELLKIYPINNESLILTAVSVNLNNEIIVHQSLDKSLNLMTGELVRSTNEFGENLFARVFKKDEEAGEIILIESGEERKIHVPFEQSFGGINVNAITSNQIIFEKTEVAAETTVIMAETHVYVIDKNGNVLGAVRMPHERVEYYSRNNIRVDHGKIYYLSAELEAAYVYELTPGKIFEKRLNERIETFFHEEIKENLLKKSEAILILLKTHDWDEFSNHVHPDGITFSFYAALGADPNNNLTFTKKETRII